jgi:hypothetical protein
MKRTLAALLLALLVPIAASATTVTVEVIAGGSEFVIGHSVFLHRQLVNTAQPSCGCFGTGTTGVKWMLAGVSAEECGNFEWIQSDTRVLACEDTPHFLGDLFNVIAHPSTNCWTLELCPQ